MNFNSYKLALAFWALALAGTGCHTDKSGDLTEAPNSTPTSTPAVTLTSITVSAPSINIPDGLSEQLTATGNYSDGSQADLTASVRWSDSNTTLASFTSGSPGLISTNAMGAVTVTAKDPTTGISSGLSLNVVSPVLVSLSLGNAQTSVTANTSYNLTVSGAFSDGSVVDVTNEVSWATSDSTIAGISQTGQLTGVALGTAAVTAAIPSANVSPATISVTVISAAQNGLVITPTNPVLPVGSTATFHAFATFADGSLAEVTGSTVWTSGSQTILQPQSGPGEISSASAGSTTLTASFGGFTASTPVTVTSASLTAVNLQVPTQIELGSTATFTATGTFSDGTVNDISSWIYWRLSTGLLGSINFNTGAAVFKAYHQIGTGVATATTVGLTGTAPSFSTTATFETVCTGAGLPAGTTAICTPSDLQGVSANLSGAYFLEADLNMAGFAFAPIGAGSSFSGSFDGNGRVITNLSISSNASGTGLFSHLSGEASVTGFELVKASIQGTDSVGGIAGIADSGATIDEVSVTGNVSGSSFVGGLVGQAAGQITRSWSSGTVAGTTSVGGLAGLASGTLSNSYSTATVSGSSDAGGLAGQSSGTITDAYSIGAVTATSGAAGGLVGSNSGTINQSYADQDTCVATQIVGSGSAGTAQFLGDAAMRQQSSYSGWDFTSTWTFSGGAVYPALEN